MLSLDMLNLEHLWGILEQRRPSKCWIKKPKFKRILRAQYTDKSSQEKGIFRIEQSQMKGRNMEKTYI